MTGNDVIEARDRLGRMWGVGRPLTRAEIARALGLSPSNGNDHVLNMEKGKSRVSGTIELLLRIYLGGALPPDDVEIFRERGRRRADSETGEMPPPNPRRKKLSDGTAA